jgi:hypothetical protein
MIFFVYASLIFLVLRFSVTLFNFLSNPKLGHYGKHFNEKVSVIFFSSGIHELDENAFHAILKQGYKDIEILIKKPEERIAETIAKTSGKYLLFVKECAMINKGLVNSLIYRMKLYDLALISIVPERAFGSWKAYCLHPLKDLILMSLFPMRLVRFINIPTFFAASQPCMFFDSETYKRNLKSEKVSKTKMELLQANKLVCVYEQDHLFALGSDLMKTLDNSYLVALTYLVLSLAGPIVIIYKFQPAFLALPFGLIFLMRLMVSFLSGQRPWVNVILHPVQMLVLATVLFREMAVGVLTLVRHKNR